MSAAASDGAPPRVGLIGARRVRQGLGPFVARFLRAHGAHVACFLGTGTASVEAARRELAQASEAAQVEPAVGYTDLETMLAAEKLDALAVLSPATTHERYLRAAGRAGVHVLCEKPLVWGGAEISARAREIAACFDEAGLLLRENCQWPWVLPAWRRLHPDAADEPVERFEMRLSPASRGPEMIGDAMPHALSLLQALHPGGEGRLEAPRFSTRDPRATELVVEFRFRTPRRTVEARVELWHGDRLPREASFSINGRHARRLVDLRDYSISLSSGPRLEPVPDPLEARLADFLSELAGARSAAPAPDPTIIPRMQMLETLSLAFQEDPP